MAAVSTYQSPSLFLAKHDTMEFAEGIPDQLHSPLAWTRDEVESLSSHWIVKLEDSEVAQVDKALASFEAKYKDLSKASKETFKLPPSLAWRLKQISHQCYQGIGFAIVRGLNPANYSPKQNLAIYAGISAYVAPQRGYIDRAHQKIQSDTFHSDGCEILSLYAQDLEPEGGRTLLSSSWQLYNDLAGKDPNSIPDIQSIAAKESIPLPLEEGDIAYINDMAIFHAHTNIDPRTTLTKLYLRDPEQDWVVPSMMADNWEDIYGPAALKKKEVWE